MIDRTGHIKRIQNAVKLQTFDQIYKPMDGASYWRRDPIRTVFIANCFAKIKI